MDVPASLYWWYKVVRTPAFLDPLLQDFEPRSQFLKLAGNPVLSMPDTEREKGVLIRILMMFTLATAHSSPLSPVSLTRGDDRRF